MRFIEVWPYPDDGGGVQMIDADRVVGFRMQPRPWKDHPDDWEVRIDVDYPTDSSTAPAGLTVYPAAMGERQFMFYSQFDAAAFVDRLDGTDQPSRHVGDYR